MSDNSIFPNQNPDGHQPSSQPGNSNTPPPQNNDLVTMLASIKNEAGEQKYKTVEDAIKALSHSQQFIEQLKQETAQARADAERARAEANKIAEMEKAVQELLQGSKQPPAQATPPNVIDEASIANIVQKTLTESQQKAVREQNLSQVVKKLQEKFGASVENEFYGKAQELGFSKAEINDLAAKSPAAVFRIFGINDGGKQPSAAPNQSSVNTTGFQPNQDSQIRVNGKSTLSGATTQEVMDEQRNARKMVDELHAQGKSVHDLTDPKVYFQIFKR